MNSGLEWNAILKLPFMPSPHQKQIQGKKGRFQNRIQKYFQSKYL